MNPSDYKEAIEQITGCADLLRAAMETAALVTRVFAERGHELVVVGGSAIEFYTEGSYMSGDIDLCKKRTAPIPLREQQDIMAQLDSRGGPRTWKVGPLFVDLLGTLENESTAPLRTLETPRGPVVLVPPELLIVERVLSATYPQPNREEEACAKKLLAVCLDNQVPVDWGEVTRLASLPSFGVSDAVARFRQEVERAAG